MSVALLASRDLPSVARAPLSSSYHHPVVGARSLLGRLGPKFLVRAALNQRESAHHRRFSCRCRRGQDSGSPLVKYEDRRWRSGCPFFFLQKLPPAIARLEKPNSERKMAASSTSSREDPDREDLQSAQSHPPPSLLNPPEWISDWKRSSISRSHLEQLVKMGWLSEFTVMAWLAP